MTALRAHTDLDDHALLRHARSGDADAFGELFDRHAAFAFAIARRVVPASDAEDVVQDAFVALWRTADRFDAERGNVRALLTVMVRSRAFDRLRRASARQAAAERAELAARIAERGRADEDADRRDAERDVAGALAALPDDQGRVVKLVYLAGHTHAEVAHHLGIPLGTAKGRSRLGLAKLRTELAQYRPAA